MVISRYSFPLPNNGERYDFSQEELVALLDKVYDSGYKYGRESLDLGVITTASSYENKDDKTKWKEVRIK